MTKDEAIQQAIDFLDGSYEAHAVRKVLQEALAQPALEPVAWQWLTSSHLRKKIPKTATPEHWQPLYTHPAPAKDWVWLSYDEITQLKDDWEIDIDHWNDFAVAIEESLKQKNYVCGHI